jgi:hypothetical protein
VSCAAGVRFSISQRMARLVSASGGPAGSHGLRRAATNRASARPGNGRRKVTRRGLRLAARRVTTIKKESIMQMIIWLPRDAEEERAVDQMIAHENFKKEFSATMRRVFGPPKMRRPARNAVKPKKRRRRLTKLDRLIAHEDYMYDLLQAMKRAFREDQTP